MRNPYPGIPYYTEDCSVLKNPLKIGAKTAPNRLVCQPMEGCDGTSDGRPGELTLRKYRRMAERSDLDRGRIDFPGNPGQSQTIMADRRK